MTEVLSNFPRSEKAFGSFVVGFSVYGLCTFVMMGLSPVSDSIPCRGFLEILGLSLSSPTSLSWFGKFAAPTIHSSALEFSVCPVCAEGIKPWAIKCLSLRKWGGRDWIKG